MKKLHITLMAMLVALLTLTGCEKKTHISDLQFGDAGGFAFKDKEPYTGEVWSEDGKTACFTYDNGCLVVLTVYHDNGKVACTAGQEEGQGSHFFDTDGNEIKENAFFTTYKNLLDKVREMRLQMDRREVTTD